MFSRYFFIFVLIVLFPFDQLFTSLFPNYTLSPFRIGTVVISIFFYQYSLHNLAKISLIIKVLIWYCGLSLLSILWSTNPDKSFWYSIQLIVSVFFAIVAVSELPKRDSFYNNFTFYTCLFGAIVAGLGLLGVFSERDLTADYRLSFANIGLNAIAISIGYTFILGVTGLFNKSHNMFQKILMLISCILIFYFLIRTGTRSSIFGVVIALLLGYLS